MDPTDNRGFSSDLPRNERRRRERETYNTVRNYSGLLYSRIVAFASTLNLSGSDEEAIRARVETFCMAIAAEVYLDGAHD